MKPRARKPSARRLSSRTATVIIARALRQGSTVRSVVRRQPGSTQLLVRLRDYSDDICIEVLK